MFRIICSLLPVTIMSPVAFCGVSGAFVETFTGAGPFLGFENSGWEAIGDAVFDDGGLLIINEAMDFETEVLYRQGRRLQQSGSFRTIVEFRELDLGLAEDHHLKLGGFGFSHLLGDDVGGGIGVQLLERQIGDEVGLWGLKLFGVGFHHDEKVQKSLPGEPVRLELVFDAEQSQVEVSYQVANDAPKRIGPFTYEGQVSPDGHNTTLFLSAVGIDQTTSGLLDYWSVVPLDAAEGDFFGDGNLGVDDINMLARAAKVSRPDSVFDIDDSGSVDDGDILYWIQDLMQTYMGDANLDGEFTSSDLVSVFTTGEYEDDIKGNSTWNEGDWNGDTEFTSGDLVLAFTDGGYEQGPRVAMSVPEPSGVLLYLATLGLALAVARKSSYSFVGTRTMIGIIGFAIIMSMAAPGIASIQGFVETFTGKGPYDGFDNPDWQIAGDGRFAGGGWAMENRGLGNGQPGSRDLLGRTVAGEGGFRTSVELSILSLGEHPTFRLGQFSLQQYVNPNLGILATLRNRGSFAGLDPPGQWTITIQIAGDGKGDALRVDVPYATGPTRLGLAYDHAASEVTVEYDNDLRDDEPAIQFGPLDFTANFSEQHLVFVSAYSSGPSVLQRGVLKHFSVQPDPPIIGDFNFNGVLDVADIDVLNESVHSFEHNPTFDLTDDGLVDEADRISWVHDLAQSYFGDANLDGEFASSDLINVFTAGEYEDGIEGNSGWATGDWNGDSDFTSSDLVFAFADGGYERGPRVANPVPEPGTWILAGTAVVAGWRSRQRRKRIAPGGNSATAYKGEAT